MYKFSYLFKLQTSDSTIGFKGFTWKVLSLKVVHLPACQNEHSPRYSSLELNYYMLLAAEKIVGVA